MSAPTNKEEHGKDVTSTKQLSGESKGIPSLISKHL